MNRFWNFLFDTRVLGVLGLAALAAFLFVGAEQMQVALVWAALALGVALVVWGLVWLVRKLLARRAAKALEQAMDDQAANSAKAAPVHKREEIAALRTRLQEAVKTIRGSKIGQLTGNAALYELPWYMVIGNPAAGKSTAVVRSGLQFPFADASGSIVQGIGGTRNCDWFFTNEGILLDTAGRYAVHEEDRQEWLGFLSLLKKHRPKAPINGIVIAVSAAELAGGKPETAIQLAKSLRQRVQELTENLAVFAPVYLVFTKADLIAGFSEFFSDSDRGERERVWGATLPYVQSEPNESVAQFDKRFDELCDGLHELSLARMGLQRGEALPPGVLTFPLEFAGLKPSLQAFVATLFEDNPYQFRPVFRGFYFTSAVQDRATSSRATDRVAQQFGLQPRGAEPAGEWAGTENGFFLKDLFSKVIFADRNLVRQYASRNKLRLRTWSLAAGVAVLALALGAWTWSYLGNRQLMANVRADLDKVVKLQTERSDLSSRLEALDTLQDRIEQLQRMRDNRPLGMSLGLYQGEAIERRLREEYFAGVSQVMLQPVAQTIEAYLGEVNANPSRLKPMVRGPESGAAPVREDGSTRRTSGARFIDASPEDSGDAYNALKTYLMLADRDRLEATHLTDQLTRFWRGWLDDNRGTMPREQMIRSAERVISFTTSNLADPSFPLLSNKLALVDQTRENLREMVRGMRGIERVYADTKARAATRYPPITVAGLLTEADKDTVAGSHAVPGTFTREAWDGYIEKAFKEAASKEMQSVDWVLKTSARDDLTLEGSPEQIRKQLTELYKTDYVREWQRFMQGVTVNEFGSFEVAVQRMNRLGDPAQSPIKGLMTLLFDQTSWDNPSLLNERLASTQKGVIEWFKQTILRQAPSRVDVNVNISAGSTKIPLGPIGREFNALTRVMMSRDNSATPMAEYLQALSKVRTRFNQIKTQGDAGPGAKLLIAQTLDGGSSELAAALRFVDESMLNGMTDTARAALRPLLVRPLIQALAVTVPPAETELNRIWAAQVYDPFQRLLAAKFPFDASSRVEASPGDMAKIFGPDGAIAKFSGEALGPLVTRRGDTIEPRAWAEVAVRLRPEFSAGFSGWVAPLEGPAGGGGGGGGGSAGGNGTGPAGGGAPASPGADQTVFQVLPQGAPGLSEYTLTIDGQTLRYRNAAPEWVNMVWPNPAGVAGARLTAVSHEGRSIEFFNEPGSYGVTRMFDLAQLRKLGGGVNEMSWSQGGQRVSLHVRVLRSPGEAPRATAGGTTPSAGGGGGGGGGGGSGPAAPPPVGAIRLKGLRLPALVAGADVAVQVPASAGQGGPGHARRRIGRKSEVNPGAPIQMLYFGKIPSRGDFVRSPHGPGLIQTLDQWLSGGIESMAADPRWKLTYDQARPAHFAFLGAHRNRGLAGHLLASGDGSGRRFPFITAGLLEVAQPLRFLTRSPMLLARAWLKFEDAARLAHEAVDASPLLAEMNQQQIDVDLSPEAYEVSFRDFVEMHTVGSLGRMLQHAGHLVDLRRLVLGLGLLLQPVLASGSDRLDKGLALPLPADSLYRPFVASFWLELIAGFLARAEFELALFLPEPGNTPATLALGFDGASARTLHALLDPEFGREVYIDAREADWVEDCIAQDYAIGKLSSYLQQEGLSLRQAVDTFKEVFLGS